MSQFCRPARSGLACNVSYSLRVGRDSRREVADASQEESEAQAQEGSGKAAGGPQEGGSKETGETSAGAARRAQGKEACRTASSTQAGGGQSGDPPSPGQRIGVVTHYYSHLSVAVVKLESARLRVGDTIHIRGHTTDFEQRVDSIQVNHASVQEAGPGDDFGLKVREHAREHDVVYKVT